MESLRCVNIRKSFDGTAVLDIAALSLPLSGFVAIIGPNGAGKTTLLNVVTGFMRPDEGKIFLDDVELTRLAPHRIVQAGLARTFQELRLISLISVLENVMLARQCQKGERLWRALTRIGVGANERANKERAMELLEFVGLAEKAHDMAGTLSYGQQKILTLACCIATDARILFLDEPVAGVHSQMAEKILGLLQTLHDDGKLVFFIEHDIPAVRQIAERVIVMDHGVVIADGPPHEVLERPEILEAYVG
ncbi:MAG TPA: ABC transporter ATP-binding protein [Phycisphaerae bacterium]|nr:ABC transporter ATP-binding protein [Phycisphaerae bacterium]